MSGTLHSWLKDAPEAGSQVFLVSRWGTLLMPEVLPTLRSQLRPSTGSVDENHLFAPGDLADAGDRSSQDLERHALVGSSGKQQFVIFAAMKRELWVNRPERFAKGRTRYCLCPNFSAHSALFTYVAEIRGKTITDIDHGRSNVFGAQKTSLLNPGLGKKMFWKLLGSQLLLFRK